ncbi:MAG: hypothetical protein H5U13_12585 [Parvibaculum sp.]|nr:hypothetical protein [Parvibaculum sp.]
MIWVIVLLGIIAAVLLFGAVAVRRALWGLLSLVASVIALFLFLTFFSDYWPYAIGVVAVTLIGAFVVIAFADAHAKKAAPVRARIAELSDKKMTLYDQGVAHDDPRVLEINRELKNLGWE